MWWWIPFPANKVANGSMMPRPCTRRKKSPSGYHADRGTVYAPGGGPEDAGPATAPGPGQDYASLWAAMPGAGENLCTVGAPDGDPTVDDGRTGGGVGPHRAGARANCPPVDRGPADTVGHHADPRLGYASANRYPIPAPHPR